MPNQLTDRDAAPASPSLENTDQNAVKRIQGLFELLTSALDLSIKVSGALSLAGFTAGIAIVAALPSSCEYKKMFVTSVDMARGAFTLMSYSFYILLILYFLSQIIKTTALAQLNIPKFEFVINLYLLKYKPSNHFVVKALLSIVLILVGYLSLDLAEKVLRVQLSTFWSIPTDTSNLDASGLCVKTPDSEPAGATHSRPEPPAQPAPQP